MERINIHVTLYTGITIKLNIKCTDTIRSIKKLIQKQEEIPQEYQRLIFINTELNDSKTCGYYDIKNSSTIICETKILLVTTPHGCMLSIKIKRSEKVQSIKVKIQNSSGFQAIRQRLFYPCCSFRGKQLPDSSNINECDIKGHQIHMLEVNSAMGVFVEILDSTRKIFYVPAEFDDTIKDLKTKIEVTAHLPVSNYKLFFMDNELQDEKSLKDYGIQNENSLQLCQDKIIYIKRLRSDKIKLHVERTDSIDDIKRKIETLYRHSYDTQNLYFHGQKLENFKTLLDYNIGFGMKLELQIGVQIFITSSCRPKITLELQLTDTVKKLKEDIERLFVFPLEYQRICFNDVHLENEEKSLVQYKIKENSTLNLEIETKKSKYFFIHFQKKNHFILVSDIKTIKDLKVKCERKLKYSLSSYDFYCQSTRLDENIPISKYKIENYSTLYLFKNNALFFFVKTLTGVTFPMNASASDTIGEVKKMIQEAEGTPPGDQRIIFAGTQWEDDKTLSDCKIKKGDIVHLVKRLRGC